MCEHNFQYAGVRYDQGVNPRPGSGATRRYYAHVYYCSKCTETKGEPIPDPHEQWNSYMDIKFGATPGTAAQCGVPAHDQWRR